MARYQSWDSYTRAMAETFVAETASLHPGMPGEWFQFAVADPSTDALLGDVALCVDADDTSRVELGFTMSPAHQGKGYATEAVTRMIAYAFERLGVEIGVRDRRRAERCVDRAPRTDRDATHDDGARAVQGRVV